MAEVLSRLSSRAIALGLGTLLLAAACSSGGSNGNNGSSGASSTDVTVWTAWGGAELKAFRDVLAPFEKNRVLYYLCHRFGWNIKLFRFGGFCESPLCKPLVAPVRKRPFGQKEAP